MSSSPSYTINHCTDFTIDGSGSHTHWETAPWAELTPALSSTSTLSSRCKILYSDTGIYVFFTSEDPLLMSSGLGDGEALYTEDAVEIFLQPDANKMVYLEYEVSPLAAELPLLVCNNNGDIMGWSPWQYTGARRCTVRTKIHGGPTQAGASISSWDAECFIPFTLFKGICNPPHTGDHWRGNMYRLDYTAPDARPQSWNWSPITALPEASFHDYKNWGHFIFG